MELPKAPRPEKARTPDPAGPVTTALLPPTELLWEVQVDYYLNTGEFLNFKKKYHYLSG